MAAHPLPIGMTRTDPPTRGYESASVTNTGTGTISGPYGIVNIANGASWLLRGSNYFEENSTLTNYGALTLSNPGLSDTGAVVNDGAILLPAYGFLSTRWQKPMRTR